MAGRNSSKGVHLRDIDNCDENAHKRGHVRSTAGDSYSSVSHSITGGSNNKNYMLQINYPHTSQGVPESLERATAHAAFHNSADRRDPPRCHENTRLAVLKEILDWVEGQDQATKDYFVMWLYGPAGSGKSAIAQTIAERLHEKGMLLASYFFARLDSSRNTSRSLISTIAYQMVSHLPVEVRQRMFCLISEDLFIFTRCLEAQIESLIVLSLQPLVTNGYFKEASKARVIIIDGLDECIDRDEQKDILYSLSIALQRHRLPIRVLITSRPELEIKDSLNSNILNSLSTRLALANDYRAYSDIKHFLSDEFQNIKQTHTLAKGLPAEWPSAETMEHLLQKSSGQFIYASTIVKFVKSKRHDPDERLRVILGLCQPERDLPFAELDLLYRHLFSNVVDWRKTSLILAFCILREDSRLFTTQAVEALLGFGLGYCRFLLCDLSSIIDLDNARSKLIFFHASVQDFLLDQSRSKEFYIDPPTWHAELTRVLLRFFQNSSLLQWQADGMDVVNLTILQPHIGQCPTIDLQELGGEILTFDVLRFFDHKISPHVAYSIPDYLSVIKNSRLEGATAIYQKKERAFYEHLKKELRGYGEAAFVNFFLLCISENFFGARGPILQGRLDQSKLLLFPPMHDSLWVVDGWTEAGSSYIQALKVAAQEIISEQSEHQTITSAALYALKEASVILTQKGTDDPCSSLVDQKAKFFLDNCKHLLEQAARYEDLINYAQDLAFPLILDHHPGGFFCEIDTATHKYLMRMGVESKQDYAFLSRYALTKLSQCEALDETELREKGGGVFGLLQSPAEVFGLLRSLAYLLEKAQWSDELINDVQNFPLQLILGTWISIEEVNTMLQRYLTRMGITFTPDYASLSLHALMRLEEWSFKVAVEEQRDKERSKARLLRTVLTESCAYLLRNASASWSEDLIYFVRFFRQSILPSLLVGYEASESLDVAIHFYLVKMGIASKTPRSRRYYY